MDRLAVVVGAAGLRVNLDDAVRLRSYSNDAWRVGEFVVRVCWRGDTERLVREAAVAAQLPAEVPYPEIVAAGMTDGMSWIITRHVEGIGLDQAWTDLDESQRRRAIIQIVSMLRELHEWIPPRPVAEVLHAHADVNPHDPTAVVQADISPLPYERTAVLLDHARALPQVDDQLISDARERLNALAPLDPFGKDEPMVVVHGDLHLANVVWRGGDVVALLDFEWVRFGPRDLDLEPLLRSTDWARAGDPELITPEETARIFGWMHEAYPRPMTDPDQTRRLWLYQLAYTMRELYTWPMDIPRAQMAADHPLNSLPRLLRSSAHLDWVKNLRCDHRR